MEYRQLGHSGLRVPVLSFGTGTFGGGNDFFKAWGNTQVEEATRLIDFEWELMPLAIEEQVGTIVWSPLSSGKLSGKYRRGKPDPKDARIAQGGNPVLGTAADDERLYAIVDVLDELSRETGKTVAQIALNWLLQRPTVANIIIGARNEEQLKQNLGAIGWNLTVDQVKRLDTVSETLPAYPYWHQRQFPMLNTAPELYRKFS